MEVAEHCHLLMLRLLLSANVLLLLVLLLRLVPSVGFDFVGLRDQKGCGRVVVVFVFVVDGSDAGHLELGQAQAGVFLQAVVIDDAAATQRWYLVLVVLLVLMLAGSGGLPFGVVVRLKVGR